jgi:hypothetical protein
MISLIIPATSISQKYTDNILKNINDLYPGVETIVEINDGVSLSDNYNNAVNKATNDKIILLHNDMFIKPGFIEIMNKHIVKGRITTYTRIEPPIYNDIYPGKVILDCGVELDGFDKQKFLNFDIQEELTDGGSQLFFGCMKEDYIGLDNKTFYPPQMWCADDDLHLRYKIAGLERKVSSAHVYHFVSKTSRLGNYQDNEIKSNINFIKKWGFRTSEYNIVYKKSYRLINTNPQLEQILDPWFNGGEDIIVEINNNFTQQDFQYIQQLNDIIKNNNELGVFSIGNLKITVNSLEEHQNNLVTLK